MQISDIGETQLIFGRDVDGWAAGRVAVIDAGADGYPLSGLRDVPAGRYRVQVLLNRYETFHRADGHIVKLPPDKGEGQQWNREAGQPLQRAAMDHVRPANAPTSSAWCWIRRFRRFRIRRRPSTSSTCGSSPSCSHEFWGKPIYLGAHVLLPEGFDAHPDARYPLVIDHGHFPATSVPGARRRRTRT